MPELGSMLIGVAIVGVIAAAISLVGSLIEKRITGDPKKETRTQTD